MFNFITSIGIGVFFEWKMAVVYLGGVVVTSVIEFVYKEIRR